jgi:hypothetical protein
MALLLRGPFGRTLDCTPVYGFNTATFGSADGLRRMRRPFSAGPRWVGIGFMGIQSYVL